MARRRPSPKKEKKTVRCSISFSAEHYRELERLAKSKKVSLAWVVRDAMDRYLAEQWPLLQGVRRFCRVVAVETND